MVTRKFSEQEFAAPSPLLIAAYLWQAAALAVEHGWAINIGGGQHHAYWEDASDGGWCLYRRALCPGSAIAQLPITCTF